MILSSHIIAASAVVAPLMAKSFDFAGGVFIFLVSFLSHYAVDAIPHWDYKVSSILEDGEKRKFVYKREFIRKDLTKNTLDGILGLLGGVLIIGFPADFIDFFAFSLLVFGALLPDALEVCYIAVWKKFPLSIAHKIHRFSHGKRIFRNRAFLGAVSQIFTLALIVLIFGIIYGR